MDKTTKKIRLNTQTTADENTIKNFLQTLTYSTKTRGGKNGNGNTCTMCKNPKTPRLYLPKRYCENGFRSGLVGVDKNNAITVVLSKKPYNGGFTSLHSTQNFITVLGENAKTLRGSYHYTISSENPVDDNTLALVLTPNNDNGETVVEKLTSETTVYR